MYAVGASEFASARASALRCCSAAEASARMRSFSWFSRASRVRRRCTMKTANPAHNRTTTPSTYHGQTSRDAVFFTTTTATCLDDGAAEDDTVADDTGSGRITAELAGAVVAAVEDGAAVDDGAVDTTTGAVTGNEATPVTFEV